MQKTVGIAEHDAAEKVLCADADQWPGRLAIDPIVQRQEERMLLKSDSVN